MNRTILRLCAAGLLCFGATAAAAQWRLVAEDSALNFVSVKNGIVAESHTFGSLSGAVDAAGNAWLEVELNSLDTRIPIRDERMREMLFETGIYPQARFSMKLNRALIANPRSQTLEVQGRLLLHGFTVPVRAELTLEPLPGDRILVYSKFPIILQAGSFGLGAGVEALRKIAGLSSITPAVPVNLTLVFARQ